MPTTTFDYNSAAACTFYRSQIVSGKAELLQQAQAGLVKTSNFTTSGEYTFDAAKISVAGTGILKNLVPTNAVVGATYTTNENLNFTSASGSLTGTLFGTASVSGGKLVATGYANNYAQYDNADLATMTGTGTIKFKYTPNYSGAPGSNNSLITIRNPSTANDLLQIYHSSSGQLRLNAYNSVGGATYGLSNLTGVWSPTSGVEYEIEISFTTTGTFYTFIDGVLQGTLSSISYTRAGAATRMYVGAALGMPVSNGSFNDVLISNVAAHTVGYTPGYSLPETKYDITNPAIELETQKINLAAPLSLTAITNFQSTEVASGSDAVKYAISRDNGATYDRWNGGAWVANTGYADANTKAEIVSGLPSLTTTSGQFKVKVFLHSNDGGTAPSVDDLIVTYSALVYPAEGWVVDSAPIQTNSLTSIAETVTKPASTDIRYVAQVNGAPKYWNGSAWVASDLTFAQANTLAVFNTNAATLVSVASNVKIYGILQSTDNVATPGLDQLSVAFAFELVENAVTTVAVSGYIKDWQGIAVNAATVEFTPTSKEWQEQNSNAISSAIQTTTTSVTGYFEINLLPGTYYVKHYKSGSYVVSKKDGDKISISVPSGSVGVDITSLI